MTVVELKEKLIAKIITTNDEGLLEHLSDIIEFEYNNESVYKMSPEEIEAVHDGIRQVENGEWISHEEANKQIAEWLKK